MYRTEDTEKALSDLDAVIKKLEQKLDKAVGLLDSAVWSLKDWSKVMDSNSDDDLIHEASQFIEDFTVEQMERAR